MRSGSLVPVGGSKYDPVWWLLKEATLLEVRLGGGSGPAAGTPASRCLPRLALCLPWPWLWLAPAHPAAPCPHACWPACLPALLAAPHAAPWCLAAPQEWGGSSRYDPLAGLCDWGPAPARAASAFLGLRYDPWADLVVAVRQASAAGAAPPAPAKYDMLADLLGGLAAAATGGRVRSRYDPAAQLLALAASPEWVGPTGGARYCMVAAALDAAAGWQAPSGASPYCPVSALLEAEPPRLGAPRWDPLGWLLDGWAANSGSWEEPALGSGGGGGPGSGGGGGWEEVSVTVGAGDQHGGEGGPAFAPAFA